MSAPSSSPPTLDYDGLRRGRPEAIAVWFEGYADAIYAFVFFRARRNPVLAAEIVQETFLSAMAKIETFDRGRGEMLPWLTFIARNAIRKALRQEDRYLSRETLSGVDERLLARLRGLDEEPLPDEILAREETAEIVRIALSGLSTAYRLVLEQRYFHQRSIGEIARFEGASEGAIKTRLHRARQAFKAAFESTLGALEGRPSIAGASS